MINRNFLAFLVDLHAEALRQEVLHHDVANFFGGVGRIFRLDIKPGAVHPVGSGDLVVLHIVGGANHVAEADVDPVDAAGVAAHADHDPAGFLGRGRLDRRDFKGRPVGGKGAAGE
jgi:hypothetical protein